MPALGVLASVATTQTSYPVSPQVAAPPFNPKSVLIMVQGTAGDELLVSTNGSQDNGAIIVGGSGPLEFHGPVATGVWFRAAAGNAATVKVAVTFQNW